MTHHAPAPSRINLAMETRAMVEYAWLRSTRHLLERVRHGDGHPVVVIPGYGLDDKAMAPLRSTLVRLGWDARPWWQGRNRGPSATVMRRLSNLVQTAHQETGRQVSLVGYSLGGLFAREVAREHPDLVRGLVTMGSPFRFRQGDESSITRIYQLLQGFLPPLSLASDLEVPPPEEQREQLQVPVTCIYSPTDGVVRSRLCLEAPGPMRENVAVLSSHTGLAWNPAALFVLADRLAQPAGQWTPFVPPRGSHLFYPRAASWVPKQVRHT